MLFSLINNNSDGKIIVSRPLQTCNGQEGGYIKYVMLTGEKTFSEVCLYCYDSILKLLEIFSILIIVNFLSGRC